MTVNMKNWQELKKPNVLDIKPGGDPKRKATFVAEPLERGFAELRAVEHTAGAGHTLFAA